MKFTKLTIVKKNCKNYDKCKKNMPNDGYRFCKAKVGKNYGKSGNPKILFIGKEGVSDSDSVEEPAKISDVPKNNTHYFATIYTAALLLTGEDSVNVSQEILLPYEHLRHEFCLTNYYKCSFTNSDKKHHNVNTNIEMSKNCKNILIDEIRVLKPNIIIMQGKFSHSSFYNSKGLLSFCTVKSSNKFGSKKEKIEFITYEYDDKTPLYIIWSYHPCAHGRKRFNSLDAFKNSLCAIPNTKYSNNN